MWDRKHRAITQAIHTNLISWVFSVTWAKALITYVTNREKARVMLHIGVGRSNNNAIFPNPELIGGNLSAKPLSISTY